MTKQIAKNQDIRRTLYRLSQSKGTDAAIFYETLTDFDDETGQQTSTLTKIDLKRFVTFGVEHKTIVRFQTLGYQVGDRWGIIYRDELEPDFVLTDEHWLVYNGKRYTFASISELDANMGYHVLLRTTQGTQRKQLVEISVESHLFVTQTVENE